MEVKAAEKLGHDAWVAAVTRWGKHTGEAQRLQKLENNEWLARVIGASPPYDYSWGLVSSENDIHDGDAVIAVHFR